jgi:hypothetical protein
MTYQPKTGARCTCRLGVQRDNCPTCEGTGWRIDFAAIRAQAAAPVRAKRCACGLYLTDPGGAFYGEGGSIHGPARCVDWYGDPIPEGEGSSREANR